MTFCLEKMSLRCFGSDVEKIKYLLKKIASWLFHYANRKSHEITKIVPSKTLGGRKNCNLLYRVIQKNVFNDK